MQARYYDPVIGRFYSNDPVGWVPGSPVHSFGRYTYANNNPYKYTDPDGKFGILGAIIGGVASGAAAYLSGARGTDLALAIGGGALAGAATGGMASVARLGGTLSSMGMGASSATGVATVAVSAMAAGTGNAASQVAGMSLDAVQGKEVRDFDVGQVATATGLGAVGAVVPALAMSAEMGITSSLTVGTFESVTSVSGVSAAGEALLGGIAAATEVSVAKAAEQMEKVYDN
jgi:hypothetical protein